MLINLNVKKKTFLNYMIQMGFNYNIVQFDLFIETIQKNVQRLLIASFMDKTLIQDSRIMLGLGSNNSLEILEDHTLINSVNEHYLISMINTGILDFYFKDRKIKKFSKEIQKNAYTLTILKNINNNNDINHHLIVENYKNLMNRFHLDNINATSCINLNGIDLTITEKKEIYNSINEKHILLILQDKRSVSKLAEDLSTLNINSKIDRQLVFKSLVKELSTIDFLHRDVSDIKVIRLKNSNSIFTTINIIDNDDLNFIYYNKKLLFKVSLWTTIIEFIEEIKSNYIQDEHFIKYYYNHENGLFNNFEDFSDFLKNLTPSNLENYSYSLIVDGEEKTYTYKSLLD